MTEYALMRQEFFVATAASQEIMSVPVVDEFLCVYHNFLVSKQNRTTINSELLFFSRFRHYTLGKNQTSFFFLFITL